MRNAGQLEVYADGTAERSYRKDVIGELVLRVPELLTPGAPEPPTPVGWFSPAATTRDDHTQRVLQGLWADLLWAQRWEVGTTYNVELDALPAQGLLVQCRDAALEERGAFGLRPGHLDHVAGEGVQRDRGGGLHGW